MRPLFIALALALPLAAAAQHSHLAEAEGLRILHAWTPATAGPEALVYMEIENEGTAPRTLTGAATDIAAAAEVVGFTYAGGAEAWQPLGTMVIPAGRHLDLAPRGLALRLSGLTAPLAEGDDLDIEVQFGDLHLEVEVEVAAADATAHSHAGHNH